MNYYYKRYGIAGSWSYWWDDFVQAGINFTTNSGYSDYTFNYSTGEFSVAGSYVNQAGPILYSGGGGSLSRSAVPYGGGNYYVSSAHRELRYYRGSYVDTIIAADGTYPADGISGSYWYERTTLAETATITYPNGGETLDGIHDITFALSNSGLRTEVGLSLNNGQSWTVLGTTAAGATSLSHDFSQDTESAQCLVRARALDGSNYGDYDQSNGVSTIFHNVAPSAPTGLSPSGGTVDRTIVQRLGWQHNDLDAQSRFELQYSADGTNWMTVAQNTSNQYCDINSGTFAVGTVYWRVRTYDSQGLPSPYSAQASFIAAAPSGAPTITAPTSPVGVARPQIAWSQADQTAYEINIIDAVGTTTWPSGQVVSMLRSVPAGADLSNSGTYTIKVRTRNAAGLWSAWATVTVTVSYTPPAVPLLTTTPNAGTGSISLTIVNPTPSGTQPRVVGCDVLRSKRGENNYIRIAAAAQSQHVDHTPESGQIYDYRLCAIGENSTTRLSDVESASILLHGAVLSLARDPEQYVPLIYNPERKNQYGRSITLSEYAGRSYLVADASEVRIDSLSLSFSIVGEENRNKLKDLINSGETLLYRDNRRRRMFCSSSAVDEIDETSGSNNMWTVSFTLTRVYYKEEV